MRARRAYLAATFLAAALSVSACGRTPAEDPLSPALSQQLSGAPPDGVAKPVWALVQDFYAARGNRAAWVDDRKPLTATRALDLLHTAPHHGLSEGNYGADALDRDLQLAAALDKRAPDRTAALAGLDARITAALLSFGRDVATGTSSPGALDSRWKARREPPDLAASLEASSNDLPGWLAKIQPQHPEYAALVKAMSALLAQEARGGWPRVRREDGVAERLAAEGFANAREFQEHHRLSTSGTLDAATIEAMNVPIDARIRQVAMNLERWRWMPDDFGERHLLVNIPAFTVYVREHGKIIEDVRVVVGKSDGHQTPVFSGTMSNVVFSPYWNVPDSIAQGETAPLAARDPGYLSRNNMEVLRHGRVIDEADVDWNDPAELRQVSFRQAPGAGNALGRVKFLFPNPYDVYLHDTPADRLFARPMRALSHGCVRVEEPEVLARYVMRGEAAWTEQKIAAAMLSGVEQHVKLHDPLPVHIVYFTTWVDEAGGLHFLPDPYGYDVRQSRAGRTGAPAPPRPRAAASKNERSAN